MLQSVSKFGGILYTPIR